MICTAPGDKLGPYEVLAPVGAGGMGKVYKARDTRLQRTVAIKVLPAPRPSRLPPFRVKPHSLALRPGIDPDKLNQFVDELEVDEFLLRWKRLA